MYILMSHPDQPAQMVPTIHANIIDAQAWIPNVTWQVRCEGYSDEYIAGWSDVSPISMPLVVIVPE